VAPCCCESTVCTGAPTKAWGSAGAGKMRLAVVTSQLFWPAIWRWAMHCQA
jgi:hypothetical protein